MKKIKVKLSDSEFKYFCQLIKEIRLPDDFTEHYCMKKIVEYELERLVSKIPKLKGKGINISIGMAEYLIIHGLITTKINVLIYYDNANIIMINSLFKKIDNEIEKMKKEEAMIANIRS